MWNVDDGFASASGASRLVVGTVLTAMTLVARGHSHMKWSGILIG